MEEKLKSILLKFPFSKRLWQIGRAILSLRYTSFRLLFLKVHRNDVCLDLGANIGFASLVMWLKGAKTIYAVEPHVEAFNILKNNLKGIKCINTFNIAISSETKKEKLYLHKNLTSNSDLRKVVKLSQASSLLPNKKNIGKEFYEIQAKSLIDLFAELKKKPTLIKCDIEGGEYIIFKQIIECAKSYKIRKIFVECHARKYPQYQNPHKEFINLIRENNLEKVIDTTWH